MGTWTGKRHSHPIAEAERYALADGRCRCSGSHARRAEGRFGKEVFVYLSDEDAYRCPAGEMLTRRFGSKEGDLTMFVYWCTTCPSCPLRSQCTTAKYRRVRRWEHEQLVETMNARMEAIDAMAIRRETAEHPFSTIKAWMGATHFLCTGLKSVRTEMSLHVLAYNLRRMMTPLGIGRLHPALAA